MVQKHKSVKSEINPDLGPWALLLPELGVWNWPFRMHKRVGSCGYYSEVLVRFQLKFPVIPRILNIIDQSQIIVTVILITLESYSW